MAAHQSEASRGLTRPGKVKALCQLPTTEYATPRHPMGARGGARGRAGGSRRGLERAVKWDSARKRVRRMRSSARALRWRERNARCEKRVQHDAHAGAHAGVDTRCKSLSA